MSLVRCTRSLRMQVGSRGLAGADLLNRCRVDASSNTSARRTFVSLNDLAKLSPFASNSDTSTPAATTNEEGVESYTESVKLPYAQRHLFNVISDVKRYEDFVPYCIQSRIVDRPTATETPRQHEFHAELTVGFGSVQERYTSKVTTVEPQSIVAEALPTPLFQRLRTSWTLKPLTQSETQVDFAVQYAFSNPLYAVMAKKAMHKMSSQMIGAFERRAEQLKDGQGR